MSDFPAFQKIARWNRDIIVTEKIDGTNGVIQIEDGQIRAGSRSRWLTLETDNFGFARWVADHSEELIEGLGPGIHYGEWYGQGIQRRYGLDEKRFMLFNTSRWGENRPECCEVSTVVWTGQMANFRVIEALDDLKINGSRHVPGFMKPEGVVIYHTASNQLFKATIEKDDEWKGKA